VKLNGQYEPVIGLEVHAQMLTRTKAFCGCPTAFGSEPNSNICPICLGMPGTLPVLNINLVEFIIRMGLAVGCTIAPRSVFARKNYFYPDLPKGYQISQYEEPICTNGSVEIDLDDGGRKRIGIMRIHMEEDAGKSVHHLDADTLVDVNRCGVPLIEIVSEPDIRSPREAYQYLWKIKQLVMYLGICDGNMEEGSLRCDANVSVRRRGEEKFGTKTEVKNLNSFRYVERALEYEVNRHVQLIEDGGTVRQETLLWDANQNAAFPMRSKEEAHDYRYFPDPDLVPVLVDEGWKEKVRQGLPELPTPRRDRFVNQLDLPRYDADVLTADKGLADYFDEALTELSFLTGKSTKENAKAVGNWVMTDVLRVIGERKIDIGQFPISPRNLASMVALISDGTISGKIAKDVFEEMLVTDAAPRTIVESKRLLQVSDTDVITRTVETVIRNHPQQVQKYLGGNEKVFSYFVGEIMKVMKGKANPRLVNEILSRTLQGLRR